MLRSVQRRARPMEMGPTSPPDESRLGSDAARGHLGDPGPGRRGRPENADPAEIAEYRESIRLAFVTALQHLPARQRAALILCEVLRWQVAEVAELLDTTRGGRQQRPAAGPSHPPRPAGRGAHPEALDGADAELLERYVDAFERYDIERTRRPVARGRRAVDAAVRPVAPGGVGHRAGGWSSPARAPAADPGCSASGPTGARPSVSTGGIHRGLRPWALQVLEITDRTDRVDELLPPPPGPRRLFPSFGTTAPHSMLSPDARHRHRPVVTGP